MPLGFPRMFNGPLDWRYETQSVHLPVVGDRHLMLYKSRSRTWWPPGSMAAGKTSGWIQVKEKSTIYYSRLQILTSYSSINAMLYHECDPAGIGTLDMHYALILILWLARLRFLGEKRCCWMGLRVLEEVESHQLASPCIPS